MDRRKFVTLIVVLFTVVLAGIAIATALRLYNQRTASVAPTAPTSIPRAQEAPPPAASNTTACQPVSFALTAAKCGDSCSPGGPAGQCPNDHTCDSGTSKCVLTSCTVAGASCDTTKCTPTNAPKCGDSCTPGGPASQCPTGDHTCDPETRKCVLTQCNQSGVSCTTDKCTVNQTTTTTTTPKCGDTCQTNANCPNDGSHICKDNKCVLATCLQSGVSCNSNRCAVTTTPSLPQAGTGTPTIIGAVLGVLAIIGALAIAL